MTTCFDFLESSSGTLQVYKYTILAHYNTGCFTTLGHNCRRWFPRFLWWKNSYKHVSDLGQLRSYDRLKLRIEGNDYW